MFSLWLASTTSFQVMLLLVLAMATFSPTAATADLADNSSCSRAAPTSTSPSLTLTHNYSLPSRLLQAAQGTVVPTAQLRRLYSLLAQPVSGVNGSVNALRVAVVGGSFSAARGHVKPWVGLVEDALRASFPRLNLSVRNAARGGTDPAYAVPCLGALIPGDWPWDLVFVEYNPNSIRQDYHARLGSPGRLNVELWEGLLRGCLALSGRPLVVVFHAHMSEIYPNDQRPIHFYDHNEEGMGLLASYYNIPMLSMRNALWHLQHAQVPGYRDADTRQATDHWHYNELGAAYAADVVLHFLSVVVPRAVQDELADRSAEGLRIAGELNDSSRFPMLYPPQNPSITLLCATMEGLGQVVQADERWTYGALHGLADKFGMFTSNTSAEGARLNFTWGCPPDWKFDRPPPRHTKKKQKPRTPTVRRVKVTFHFFCSNKPSWASARLVCLQGCSCKAHVFSAMWGHKSAASSWRTVEAVPVPGAACVIQLQVLKGPEGGTLFYLHSVSVAT